MIFWKKILFNENLGKLVLPFGLVSLSLAGGIYYFNSYDQKVVLCKTQDDLELKAIECQRLIRKYKVIYIAIIFYYRSLV